MKTPAWRKWRAKLLAVMRTRVTLLNNWPAKFISLLLATTVWYLIKKNIDHTLAVWKVLPGANYGNALKGDLQTRRDRRDYLRLLLDVTPSLGGCGRGRAEPLSQVGELFENGLASECRAPV